MSQLSAPVLVVRTPDGDVWPTHGVLIEHDVDEEPLAVVRPNPPSGSAIFRSQHQVVEGVYMEVEIKVCDV